MKTVGKILIAVATLAVAVVLAAPYMARPLIHSDPLAHADAIVVLGSFRLERTLEAGSLFREGWSTRILLTHPPDVASRGILRTLNIRVPVWLDIQKSALAQMSVPAAAILIPVRTQDTTRSEAEFTAEFARMNGWKRVIIVTSPYHSGRAGRLFRKAAGTSFTVIMRPDRYEHADPDHWWRHPVDRADVMFEYMKDIHALTPLED